MRHSSSATQFRKPIFSVILLAGLLAGLLDIIAACVKYYINTGKPPGIIFKFIASGVFGSRAFAGGNAMIIGGFVFHFLIAILFAAFFVWLYTKLRFLASNTILWGLLYGILVWAIMNWLVLPLSHVPAGKFDLKEAVIAILILMLMVGLPIALVTKQYKH